MILCPLNGMVKVLENEFRGIICSFAVNNWSNLWRYWNQMIAYLTIFVLPEGTPQGTHTVCVCVCECVCKRLLFCSKCTGFTVRLTYNDISLSMYINQCEINLELPYLWYIVVLLPQKRFWAILSSPFTVNGELKILQNRSKKRFWGKRTTKVLVWSCR